MDNRIIPKWDISLSEKLKERKKYKFIKTEDFERYQKGTYQHRLLSFNKLYFKEDTMSEVKIESFAGNSNKDREVKKPAKKEIKKVVKGDVKTRKKPIGKRVIEALLPKEDISVKDYIMFDVIVPCIKDTILDSISMVFYGTTSRRDRKYRKANSGGTRISYASYYKDDDDDRRDRRSRRSETSSIDDIIFETRAEAQEVLNSLADIIDEYGSASIADFCDLCGITEEYTDHKYGWSDVSKSTIEAVRGGGFVINLPRARQIG